MIAFRIAVLCIGAAALYPPMALAQDYKQGDLTISHPWARPSAQGAKNGAAYLSLKNDGKEPDTLVSAESPAAEKTEIHEHIHDGDVMRMRLVQGGVPVPAGGTVEFKPGGYHLMLLGLKQKLEEGKTAPLKLTFAKAGSVDVEVKIEKSASQDGGGQSGHHH